MIGWQTAWLLLGLALIGWGLVMLLGWPAIAIVAGVAVIVLAVALFG